MSAFKFNGVYVIQRPPYQGVWRVVCVLPQEFECVLVRLPFELGLVEGADKKSKAPGPRDFKIELARIQKSFADDLWEGGSPEAKEINLFFGESLTRTRAELDEGKRTKLDRPSTAMAAFLNPNSLAENFRLENDFGRMIRPLIIPDKDSCTKTIARSVAYEWLKKLCLYGFYESSLNERVDNRGAPGVPRVYGEKLKKPGVKSAAEKIVARIGEEEARKQNIIVTATKGIALETRNRIINLHNAFARPGLSRPEIFRKVAKVLWCKGWYEVKGEMIPIFPTDGTMPSQSRYDYLINKSISRIARLMSRTTARHFLRTARGLHGTSRDGVAGPGHVFAMDSTVGDIYLSSTITRSWCIGRPIVYWIIDVWSTAIVGFYVCFRPPSWAMAKIALYCAVAPQAQTAVLGSCAGRELGLFPRPTLPAAYRVDRGEYLSQGAQETAQSLSCGFEFNDAARPDLKGIVEVFNRIQKDEAYGLIPGAMDARRKELELRPNMEQSDLIPSEFVEYLRSFALTKNLSADRRHLCHAEMIAAGYPRTPAGLWKWGFDAGIGFQSSQHPALIQTLLPQVPVTIKDNGLIVSGIRYINEDISIETWTGEARNFGNIELTGHHMPSSISDIHVTLPGQNELRRFILAPNEYAEPIASWAEVEDAREIGRAQTPSQDLEALAIKIAHDNKIEMLKAKSADAAAAERMKGNAMLPAPPIPLARQLEIGSQGATPLPALPAPPMRPEPVSSDDDYLMSLID